MKHPIKALVLVLASFLAPLAANAAASEGKILKVTGTVEVQLPGQASVPASVGMAVPQGAVIKTGSDGQALLETFNGGVASIQPDTLVNVEMLKVEKQGDKVVSQEATLDLKRGNIVSTLDPAKKNINKYSIKTPKGVAAARGTVYSVKINGLGEGAVTALHGTVQVTTDTGTIQMPVGGGPALFIPLGGGTGSAVTIDAAVLQANPGLANDIVAAVQAVSNVVAENVSSVSGRTVTTDGGTVKVANQNSVSTDAKVESTATAVLAAVVKASVSALASAPSASTDIAAITKAAVAAVSTSTSATGGSNDAIAAVTAAAVAGAPTKAAEITQTAATTVVQTKVAEAVASAGSDPVAKQAAAQVATQQATAAVAVVAQAVVNTVAAVTIGSPAEKAAAAQAVVGAVNQAAATGTQTGVNAAAASTGTSTATPTVTPATAPTVDEVKTVTPPAVTPPAGEVVVTPVDPTTRSPQ